MQIEAITFDVGSTLIEPSPAVEQMFCHIAEVRGHPMRLEEVAVHMDEVDDFYESEYAKDGDFWCSREGSVGIWLDMYRYLSHLTGLAGDAEGMARSIYSEYAKPGSWRPYGDVRETLMVLRQRHIKMAIVSNWDPALTGIIEGLNLAPFFDEIVSSADVGYRKPDPAIFEIALERLGVSSGACLHVGDLPEADGRGAVAAGMKPVIIDRCDTCVGCGFTRVERLTDLPALVDALCI